MGEQENRQTDRTVVEQHLQALALASREDLDDLLTELLCTTHRTISAQTN